MDGSVNTACITRS